MRKLLIFALLLAAGLFALWRMDREGFTFQREPAEPQASTDTEAAAPEAAPPDAVTPANPPLGTQDPNGEEGQNPEGNQSPAFRAQIKGPASFNKYDQETGRRLFSFEAKDTQAIDAEAFQYRFLGVTVRTYDAVSEEQTAVLVSDAAEGTLDISRTGCLTGLANEGLLSMENVTVDVLQGHPLAPLKLTGEKIDVRIALGQFQSSGQSPVELIGQGIAAKGWALDMDRASGHVHFLGGGEFDFTLEDGSRAHFVTEKGTPLRLNRVETAGATQFTAHVDGGGTLTLEGDDPWTLEARGLSVLASRVGQDSLQIDRVDTSGTIRAQRGSNVFSGSGAKLVRLADMDGLDLSIQDNPKAAISFEDSTGQARTVELRGKGPLIVHAESSEGSSEQADVEFQNEGSIQFPDMSEPTEVRFEQGLSLWVDPMHGSGTFRAAGNVVMEQGAAWLRTQVLDSIVWSAEQRTVDVNCEGLTRARLVDAEGAQLDFASERGALINVQGSNWSVPQASGVHTTQVGGAPMEVRAEELRDLDWASRTFQAWGRVTMQNPLGSVQCERMESQGPDHLTLSGTEEQRVVLELLAGSAISKEVLSGTISALEIDLTPDRIACTGRVTSDLLLIQGRLNQSAESLLLTLDRSQGTDLSYQVLGTGACIATWQVQGEEQMYLDCERFQLDGTIAQGLVANRGLTSKPEANPFALEVQGVRSMRWNQDGDPLSLSCGTLTASGQVWVGPTEQRVEPETFRADGGVDVVAQGKIRANVSGKTLELEGTPRTLHLTPFEGESVVVTGLLPELDLTYRLQSKSVTLSEERLLAEEPEFRVGIALFPSGTAGGIQSAESFLRAGRLLVTGQGIVLNEGVFASGTDVAGVPITVRSDSLTLKGDVRRSIGKNPDLSAMDRVEIEGGFQVVYGGLARASGREMVVLPSSMLLKGDSQLRVRVELADLYIETERLEFNLQEFLVRTTRGVMRGGSDAGAWALDYAALEPIQRNGETMFAITSPLFSEGTRTANANWAMVWIHPEAWRQRGRAALWGEPLPEEQPWAPNEVSEGYRPDAMEELLLGLSKEKLPHYLRAALLEGNVEASVGGRRLARADSLYVDVDGTKAWLKNAELSRILRVGKKDHKLRIKSGELVALPTGALQAESATITTCDHDTPHYVIETRDLKLTPRADQRWRFSAQRNRIAFQGGWGLPMPSIRNVILDERGGFEGFENDAGEVTTVDNIVLQNTPRFGTALGTKLAYDIDRFGRILASVFQFDADQVRGKWKIDGAWLSSRGPLLGLGLQLREAGRERAKREEFWLDLFLRGIPDQGEDRGILRVPKNETDGLRWWASARGRYPFDDRQWIDVVFNHQNDPGVQAEFFQNEYQRFEERDSYVHWRKARDGHYFNARFQWQENDFRTVVEELPSVGAFRGLQELFRVGPVSVNYTASVDAAQLQRREGDTRYEPAFLDAAGVPDGLGDRSVLRADTTHRLEMPLPLGIPGTSLTPFAEARFTAWDEGVIESDAPTRFASYAGARLQSLFTQVSGKSYHTLVPRVSYAQNVDMQRTGGEAVIFDEVERLQGADVTEVGLRSLWRRPDIGRWLDFDVSWQGRSNQENGAPDAQELRFLGGFRTEFGDVPVGIEQDLRQDLENETTLYSRSIFAVRPTEDLLMQLGHQRGAEEGQGALFETASLDLRYRLNPKWEIGLTNYTSILEGGNLQSQVTLRRFSHDFVLELEVSRFAGEGGTSIGINLAPLLAWKRPRLGILDR